MLNKLHTLYPNSIIENKMPDSHYQAGYHWFYHQEAEQWLGVPSKEVTEEELLLLKTLFEYHEPLFTLASSAQSWYEFLFLGGDIPETIKESPYRIIQFIVSDGEWEQEDLEQTFKGFFPDKVIILWTEKTKGFIIEEFIHDSPAEEDFHSLSIALESDLFITTHFYLGIPQGMKRDYPNFFREERTFFTKGISLMPSERVFTYEKVFPPSVIAGLQDELRSSLSYRLHYLKDDPELLSTIKTFLQNNFNVSLTAKKLYIHRNTLQYRLDKFVEKTGIHLKNFDSAATVYFACLLFDIKK